MISFTDKAKDRVKGFMEKDTRATVLRIKISGKSLSGFNYQFFLEAEEDGKSNDTVVDAGSFKVRVDEKSASDLKGSQVDWVDEVTGAGFKVENPNPPMPHLDSPLAHKIQELLDADINPALAGHGGGAEIVDLRGDTLVLKMSGGCQGCSQSAATLRQGIEVRVKQMFPEIKNVVDATDHASGENPYYA
jgi:Fe/S biogenesis protein NfuA